MREKLTTRFIKALEAANAPYEVCDTDLKGFVLRVQPSGSMSYYFSYRNTAGKRCRYCIGKVGKLTIAQARETAEMLSAEVVQGRDIQASKKNHKRKQQEVAGNTLEAFISNHYKGWVLTKHRQGDRTLRRLAFSFGFLSKYPLADINHLTIEKWRQEVLQRGKKASSINRDLVALQSLLSKAVEWGLLDTHPLKKLKQLPLDKKSRVRFLSYEEERSVRSFLKARDETATPLQFKDFLTPLVVLTINTGLRRGELFNLTWRDINFSKRLLTVEGHTAKTGQTRHVPLNREANQVLLDWRVQQQEKNPLVSWVFVKKHGEKLSQIDFFWKLLVRATQITNCRFHDLRHHFASKLVMAGVDLNTVRELLGHASIDMTLRYAHLAPEHKAKAVEKLDTFQLPKAP